MGNSEITGWGYRLGGEIKTTQDLIDQHGIDTTPEKTFELTGINKRAICADGENGITLSVEAGRRALEMANLEPDQIDLLILATTTSPQTVPAMSSIVQSELGLANAGACDLNAACAGFGYGMVFSDSLIKTGQMKTIMLTGTDTVFSSIIDPKDRDTGAVFADGSGTFILSATERDCGLLGSYLVANGEDADLLFCPLGGKLRMRGHEVFRKAVRLIPNIGNVAMERARIGIDNVDMFIPHQANTRIIDEGAIRLGIKEGKASSRVTDYLDGMGNMSAGTMPIAFAKAMEDGRIKQGDILLFDGFGAGMTASGVVWRM